MANVSEFKFPFEGEELDALLKMRNDATAQAAKALEDLLKFSAGVVPAVEQARTRFESSMAVIKTIDWAIENATRAQRERQQDAQADRQIKIAESQAKSTEAQTELSRSIKWATWVMTAAIIGQAAIAWFAWRWPHTP
jgi:hypothetical protein